MHLTTDELIEWRDHGRPDDRRHVVEHLAICDPCGRRCAELVRTRPLDRVDRRLIAWVYAARGRRVLRAAAGTRRPAWRSWIFAPAALALALGASWLLVEVRPGFAPRLREPSVADIRGGGLQLLSPAGTVEAPFSFRWTSPYAGVRFRLDLFDASRRLLYSATVEREALEPAPDLRASLRPGVVYVWTVTAVDADGAVVATSVPQTFVFR